MLDFIDYLKKENIIENLKQYYKFSFRDNSEEVFLEKIYENLNLLKKNKANEKNGKTVITENLEFDIISSLYEYTLNHKKKKKLGEFYTPISVVNYILDALGYNNLNNIENKKIIDISCGSGSFIIHTVRILIKKYLEIYGKKEISELTTEEAKGIISKVKNNIFGIDINQIACILCQINIHFELFDIMELIRKSDSYYHLPKFNIENNNTLMMDHAEKYDFVVGNPPYLFIRDIPHDQRQIIENRDYKTNEGQYDYYQIFLEIGLRILKPHGILGYIVPDSLLALSNRSIIRKYIYNNTNIKEIYHTGPRFNDPVVSNIILILEKEPHIIERKKNQIILKTIPDQEKTIPQEIIEKWKYKFLIHLNRIDISIIEHLTTNFIRLKDLNKKSEFKFSLSRGVELTKTGKIIYCENCRKYLPIPKNLLKCRECNSPLNKGRTENIIYDTVPEDKLKKKYKLYLYSISRYQKTQYKYIDTSKIGINYKKSNLYEDRIVIRQLSQNNKICATYEKNLSLTSQSFYNLKIKKSPISDFNHFYLLGILNSMLLSYFFIKSFGSYKRLFPRILIEKIKEFPIKVPISDKEKQKAKKIIEIVKIILNNIDEMENLQNKVDVLVFDLYEISETNRKYILNYMNTLNN
ncbi:MAG: N-6 DNA methylase [Candidatus Lokiarchaeota archaeon]|nr:N-6 DNA methylase [Candidatus Lokiarchaeota archaeon]